MTYRGQRIERERAEVRRLVRIVMNDTASARELLDAYIVVMALIPGHIRRLIQSAEITPAKDK